MKSKNEELQLKEEIIRAIKTVHDPEIPVDVYELGLIYDIQILPINNVHILITLTSPSCPAAESIPKDIKDRVEMIKEINDVEVEITFDLDVVQGWLTRHLKAEIL